MRPPETPPATVVGVDGCPGGWVAAFVTGQAVEWRLFPGFAELLTAATRAGARAVGVDIPIGLPDAGRRRADVAARAFLGPARSSIFWTPPADVVARWRTDPAHPRGAGVSLQTWNIVDKIVDVADALAARASDAGGPPVLEVHPECSFRALAPDLAHASKKTAAGTRQRVEALRGWVDLPDVAPPARGVFEDALDATLAAWSADRHVRGAHRTLPADPAPGEPVVTV